MEKFKNGALWVAGLIVALFGGIFILFTRNRSLKEGLAQSKASSEDVALKTEEKAIDEKSIDAMLDYERTRDEYLRNNPLGASDVSGRDSQR